MKVTASTTKSENGKKVKDQSVSCDVNIPEDLQQLIDTFGETVVAAAAVDSIVISAQAQMRRYMTPAVNKAGQVTRAAQSASEIQTHMATWKPDAKSVTRQSAFEKASSTLDKLSPDERKALLEKLKALA